MNKTEEAADILLKAYTAHKRIVGLPDACRPSDQNEAYQCQNQLTDQMLIHYGGKKIGYKLACTNKSAQNRVNMNEPFYGLLLSAFVQTSPAKLNSNNFFMRAIEPEFSFQMAADLPARDSKYTKEEINNAIEAVLPSIEIVDSHYQEWTSIGGISLIADNACNAAWIHGKAYKNWTALDLAKHEVDLYVNGAPVRKGRGYAVMGHPLNALVWLANMLSQQGKGLKAGDFVSTGITCEIYFAECSDQITADFGSIGTVELSFT